MPFGTLAVDVPLRPVAVRVVAVDDDSDLVSVVHDVCLWLREPPAPRFRGSATVKFEAPFPALAQP